MKILAFLGSPRKQGNTATVWNAATAILAPHHTVTTVHLVDHDVHGCLGCGHCKEVPDRVGCVQEDDAAVLFERLLAADAVVYASPLYCWGFPAQLKAFVDRHFCLVKQGGDADQSSLVRGKPMALLVTCAGPREDNADLLETAFVRMGHYLGSRVIGSYVVPFCTVPEQMGPEGTATAARLAADMAALGSR